MFLSFATELAAQTVRVRDATSSHHGGVAVVLRVPPAAVLTPQGPVGATLPGGRNDASPGAWAYDPGIGSRTSMSGDVKVGVWATPGV